MLFVYKILLFDDEGCKFIRVCVLVNTTSFLLVCLFVLGDFFLEDKLLYLSYKDIINSLSNSYDFTVLMNRNNADVLIHVSVIFMFQCLDAVKSAKWPTMDVKPLDPSEKEQIVTGYLEKIYGKTLSQEQKALIVEAPQTNNPLYLRALLDEVIKNMKHGDLYHVLQSLLSSL